MKKTRYQITVFGNRSTYLDEDEIKYHFTSTNNMFLIDNVFVE